ncbi:NBAS subunit of NRZ tethering complex isoform X2 [Denticeps clupeoides]|uniref:NBAS subunit of NRZ tethering complex isoform X2 n=1 Tax=Denticeps clupeoides TaxID=299321 RepID=UPI0010A44B07|nr:neuroblastoma-amplified sequence isoform X2 [Denticeps clupeoides]
MAAGDAAAEKQEKQEKQDEKILYDLIINTEWPPEADTQLRGNKDRGSSLITKTVTGPIRFVLHYLWYSPSSSCLPPALVRLASKQINWQLVLASNGKLLAIVQDQCVEIRSARDDFGSIIGKCQVPKDPNPTWRRVAWSHDCALLAYADSTGTVRVFDLMGSELFLIPPAAGFAGEPSCGAAGLVFLEYRGSAQWSSELLVITYSGQLKSYLVSVGTNQGFQENHTFNFSTHYTGGVTTAIYHPGHRMLLIGGCESDADDASRATRCGITAWRLLSGQPHYKQVTSYEDDVGAYQRRGFLRFPAFKIFSRQSDEKDGVFRMSLSPDGALLAVLHLSGNLSLWDVPSFKQRNCWEQEQQPGYEEVNPEWKTSLEKRKKIKDKDQYYSLTDVSWWDNGALILARCSGSLTVSSVRTLQNLLGKSCEWFEPSPRVTPAHDGGFLSLECEVKLAQKRSRLEGNEDHDGGAGDEDSDSDDESSAKARYFGYVKQGLYFVTEMERFAPPRKRPRTVIKTYRLLSLRSTTPEELYQRKIDNEEYGEALSLAQAYGLDSDLVYQRQWRKSTVSIASIQDYLSKIRKRSWVLHECLERVPENVDAAKELLQYGLKGTDLEALIAIGNGEDGGRFILPGDLDVDDAPYEELSAHEEMERRSEREKRKTQEMISKVDFSRLTLEQKELCRSRLKLLSYLDRLATYEEILGGPHAAERHYDAEFFKTFRNQNIVLSARNYARESNVLALDILFTYHGSELLQHRLALLCNFPETTSPHEYTTLLPEACADERGALVCIPWDEQRHRDKDWCEEITCRSVVEPNPPDEDYFLYVEKAELLRFRTADPPITLLTDWYLTQAQDIEGNSRQVDCALSLIRLGMERKIPGLERLCDDLVTLETLVYEASCDLSMSLRELQQLPDIDKLRLLMKNSSDERYVRNCFQWMVPFLQRCEGTCEGAATNLLREYLTALSQHDLALPLRVFQQSKPDCHQKIISDPDLLMSVALECMYSNQRDDQLSLSYDVLECLPQRGYGSDTEATRVLHDQVDQLEKHLSVVEVLEKQGLPKPVSFVKKSQKSPEEARQLMIKLTRHMGRKIPPASENMWRELLQDLLEMQKSVYTCLEPKVCNEIFTESLLCSGRQDNIRLAGQLMHCSAVSQDTPISVSFRGKGHARVSYQRSVELVLEAAREYFNSSTTVRDPCMALAGTCLQLISDCPQHVQEELDLISAVSQLEEFNVKILPLQVRLRSDRLSLVKECVSQCVSAYRQASSLLDLARLLRVAGEDEDERKGQVLTLLAGQALRCEDFRASYSHCQELVSAGYSAGWEVCASLGQCENFGDVVARQELLAFSLTHCPTSNIQRLLTASSALQTQVLYQAVNFQKNPNPSEASVLNADPQKALGPGQSSDLLLRTTTRTMEVLTQTSETTRALLNIVSDKQWWRESIQNLRPALGKKQAPTFASSANHNADLELQACSVFYETLFNNPYIHTSEEVYSSYEYTPREDFAEVLLRTGKLAETSSEGQNLFPATEVLLQLACDAFPRDMTLALAYLLALPQVLDANSCLEQQPVSALSLQLAAFYYSLQIYNHLAPCMKDKTHPLYRVDPKDLIGLAQVLQGLGRGVDTHRFSADAQYKKHTILGLAETLDDSVYRISVSLARRYSVPLWEVFMTHLEFLFTDSGLSTKEIEERSISLGLLTTLKNDPEAFYSHMVKYVYPAVSGTDLSRLLLYYSLLESCDCGQNIGSVMKPDTHVKLLKKLKAVAHGLDYRKLTDEQSDPLVALESILTSQNVLSISKLATRIPLGSGGTLTPSAVHAAWLKKLFWSGDPQVLKKTPKTDQEFLHAFDTCAKYLDRLLPADAVSFVDSVTFSPEAANQLSVEVRSDVCKRALKCLQNIAEKYKKKSGDDKDKFEEVLTHLNQSLAHLETLGHVFPLYLKTSHQVELQRYSRLYDLSRSERSKVHQLAVTMAMDGQPLEQIQQLLEAAVGTLDLSIKRVVEDAVMQVVAGFSGDEVVLQEYPDPLKVLEGVVSAVHVHVQDRGQAVCSDDVLAWLRPFCEDGSRPARLRIEVLSVLERSFSLSEQDAQLLLLYRSQMVMKAAWPERELEMKDVADEPTRFALFLDLLSSTTKWEELQHIILLLQAWPSMTGDNSIDPGRNPWVSVTAALLSRCSPGSEVVGGAEVLSMCRCLYQTRQQLPPQCVSRVSSLLWDRDLKLPALKLLAESGHQDLVSLLLGRLRAIEQVDEGTCDVELLSLLLDAGLLVGCVETPFYPHLVTHLLSHGKEAGRDVEDLARELKEAGHGAQAGSLLLAYRGTHPGLVTFSSALSVIRKWL